MPDETGVELVFKIRQHPDLAELPVVFVTAYRERVAAVAASDPYVIKVIDKPFHIDEVTEAINSVLGKGADG